MVNVELIFFSERFAVFLLGSGSKCGRGGPVVDVDSVQRYLVVLDVSTTSIKKVPREERR